jgi:uncharacterized protein YkwD
MSPHAHGSGPHRASCTPRRLLAAVPAALAGVALALVGPAAASPASELAPPGRCPDITATAPAAAQETAMRCLINYAREEHGLDRLPSVAALDHSSEHKNTLMLSCNDFSHDACGRRWYRVFVQAGYRGTYYGENIAWASQSIGSPRQVMTLWLHSPEHRGNILRRGWTQQGVSVRVGMTFQGEDQVNVWTSEFGRGEETAAQRTRARAADVGSRRR